MLYADRLCEDGRSPIICMRRFRSGVCVWWIGRVEAGGLSS
jgi:hypothetical protein